MARASDRRSGSVFTDTTVVVAVLILGLGGLTAGCGVEVVGPATGNTTAPSAQTQPIQDEPTPQAPSPVASSAASGDSEVAEPSETESAPATERDKARRSYWEPEVAVTTGCPGGSLVLTQSNQVVKIGENCAKVKVSAPFVTVLAEDVDTLVVTAEGSFGHFLIKKLGRVESPAPFCFVYWERGNPVVKVSGLKTVAKKNPTTG